MEQSKYEWHIVSHRDTKLEEIFDSAEAAADRLQEVWENDSWAYIIPCEPGRGPRHG